MKKLIISLAAAFSFCSVASAQDNKAESEKAKKANMIAAFTDKFGDQLLTAGYETASVKKFMTCYAEDMDKSFNFKELDIFITLQKANTEKVEMTEEMRHQAMQLRPKMATLGQSCNALLSK